MRRIVLLSLAAGALLLLAPAAFAGCWNCYTGCCEAASSSSSGRVACLSQRICGTGCYCYSCTTSGTICTGTAPPDCDNPNEACEEHQSLRTVPHGEPVDLELLAHPETFVPAPPTGVDGAAACTQELSHA